MGKKVCEVINYGGKETEVMMGGLCSFVPKLQCVSAANDPRGGFEEQLSGRVSVYESGEGKQE